MEVSQRMRAIDRAERCGRGAGALVALGAASTALPGMIRAVRERGPASGHPEWVFTPVRLVGLATGWFGAAAAAWRPLPIRPGPTSRWTLLVGGLALYLGGMALSAAGRLALGPSYRPSSSLGATLAADHRLVTTGPFSVIRHPMYLGLMLAAVGALGVYRTWSTALFVLQLPVLVIRARREDELLARTFGEVWGCYAARVPAWLPRPRRDLRSDLAARLDPLASAPDARDQRQASRISRAKELSWEWAASDAEKVAMAESTRGTI